MSIRVLVLVSAVAVASAGCRRDQPAQVAESQTQSPPIATHSPAALSGCLRAGEAANTFVLMTSGPDAATYHLVADENIDLREHVGRRVELDGVIRQQQSSSARATAPGDDEPVGTAGQRPTVSTRTEVDVRRFEVSAVKSVGSECK